VPIRAKDFRVVGLFPLLFVELPHLPTSPSASVYLNYYLRFHSFPHV